MPKGRELAALSVTPEELAQLVAWSKRPKTAEQILDSVARFCERALETGH